MVNIDRVYQKVLALANKEQRGYITPQEFNLFADIAQMEIFEQYFFDTEQRQRGNGIQTDYSDIVDYNYEKLNRFLGSRELSPSDNHGTIILPDQNLIHKLGSVYVDYRGSNPSLLGSVAASHILERDQRILMRYSFSSGLKSIVRPTEQNPVYVYNNNTFPIEKIRITPYPDQTLDKVIVNYIRKPITPNWTYISVANQGTALYNPNATDHQDFELHSSEENKLVLKILQYSGVTLKDTQLLQAASSKEIMNQQQEKQ